MVGTCRGPTRTGGVFYPAKNGGKVKKNDIFVIRVNHKGNLGNSRPCYNCLDMMRAVGIKRVYYTDDKGDVVCENVKDMISIQASAVTKLIHIVNTSSENISWDIYFESLLKKLFPPKIKRTNFDNFIKHNLVNVLPGHKYIIKSETGIDIVSIIDSNDKIIVSSHLI
jgi:hypothetical protein